MNETTLAQVIAAFNALHDADPSRRVWQGEEQATERVWCDAVAAWVLALEPDPEPALRIAAHAQHLERWRDPRSDWPAGRSGYLRWRRAQQARHATRAAEVLASAGCEPELIERVQGLLRKEDLTRDPAAATLEDAACLAFLELDLEDFAQRHPRADVLRILRRTWRKMSPRGRDAAAGLALGSEAAALVEEALADD